MEENRQHNFKMSPWRNPTIEEEYNNTYLSCPAGNRPLIVSWNFSILYYQKIRTEMFMKKKKRKTGQLEGKLTD